MNRAFTAVAGFELGASESFTYDEDGNMTEDGTFEYAWNGENRLIQVEPSSATTNDLRLTFTYDYMGRRVQNVVETYDGSSWSTNAVAKFVWDGWLLIAELDGLDSDALTRTHTWGLDLSGTFQGAGGISGLLMVDDDTGDGFCGYFAYDGNGNVGQVLDAEDLSTDAHYEYDPYGLEIVSSGMYAEDNPWRFSTKWLDVLDPGGDDASLLYYGYRHLSPRLGRWLRRDPYGDPTPALTASSLGGGAPPAHDLLASSTYYTYVSNRPIAANDIHGLFAWWPAKREYRRWSPMSDGTGFWREQWRTLDGGVIIIRSDPAGRYNCHGYTYGGYEHLLGPWSPANLNEALKIHRAMKYEPICCGMASDDDVVVFYGGRGHSARVREVVLRRAKFDERRSKLEHKDGWALAGPSKATFWDAIRKYGTYRCFSNDRRQGCCPEKGANELTL